MVKLNRESGFTLLELMIVVVVIGILASIAYPSYIEHVRKGNRAAAKAFLVEVANKQQQLYMDSRAFGSETDLAAVGVAPRDAVLEHYTFAVSGVTTTPPAYTASLSPKSTMMSGDYTYSVLASGQRTQSKGSTTESW